MTTAAAPYRGTWFPELPSGWSQTRLDHVASVHARIGWKALTADEYLPEGYVFLATPNIKGERIDFENVNYISTFRYEESPELQLHPGDVLLAKDGATLGITNVVRELVRPATVNGSIAVIRPFGVDSRFLRYFLSSAVVQGLIDAMKNGMGVPHLFQDDLKRFPIARPPMSHQRIIADFLDAETTRIEELVTKKRRLVALLEERVEGLVRQRIADSGLVASIPRTPSRPIKRLLMKVNRPAIPGGGMVTAFRDGQVTARALRRAEGYTESWSEGLNVQGVRKGDVVIHGLDGFAGAIGVSEVDGVCSPIYHVCTPTGEADAVYLARMLRILAVSGYLGLFASSTRERAVDFRNWDLFGRIPIPEVYAPEQREVAHMIRRIRPLKTAVEQSAELANERRQALITAAVAGQLNVPGAAAA